MLYMKSESNLFSVETVAYLTSVSSPSIPSACTYVLQNLLLLEALYRKLDRWVILLIEHIWVFWCWPFNRFQVSFAVLTFHMSGCGRFSTPVVHGAVTGFDSESHRRRTSRDLHALRSFHVCQLFYAKHRIHFVYCCSRSLHLAPSGCTASQN